MSEEIWTIIKYKPKEGCEDKFVEGLKRLEQIIEKSKAGQEFQNKFIKIDSGEYVQIIGLPNLESLLDGQIEGLDWLDSVDHCSTIMKMTAAPKLSRALSLIETAPTRAYAILEP